MATTLKGRAASPIRPGTIVKNVLSGQIPLETRTGTKYVSAACMTDLHYTYKQYIKRENYNREPDKQLRGMVNSSFRTWFRFSRYLNLTEKTGEEPANVPIALRYIAKTELGKNVIQRPKRILYALTSTGIREERMWQDLTKAWKEQWEPGRPAVVGELKPIVVRKWSLPKDVDEDALNKAAKQLEYLIALAPVSEEAQDEIFIIIRDIGKWITSIDDSLDQAREQYESMGGEFRLEDIQILETWSEGLKAAFNTLTSMEFDDGIRLLRELARELEG